MAQLGPADQEVAEGPDGVFSMGRHFLMVVFSPMRELIGDDHDIVIAGEVMPHLKITDHSLSAEPAQFHEGFPLDDRIEWRSIEHVPAM